MAYRANPFLERLSEKNSDQEFVARFSPKILERLGEESFSGGVHIIRSAPGGGKTTLMRAFTPSVVREFYMARSRPAPELKEAYPLLEARGVVDETGPRLLGVSLSCAAGYADLPPGTGTDDAAFRALFDCRVVFRTLSALASFLDLDSESDLADVVVDHPQLSMPRRAIPELATALELLGWAREQEHRVFAALDSFGATDQSGLPRHERFESILWLQAAQFRHKGVEVAPRRMLLVDDIQKLRRSQREQLTDELVVMRPQFPVWLAMRTFALGDQLLTQGAREGRDIHEIAIEELWEGKASQFQSFALSVLDKRMALQDVIPVKSFAQCVSEDLDAKEMVDYPLRAMEAFRRATRTHEGSNRYTEWFARAARRENEFTLDAVEDLYMTRIQMARDVRKRQMSLDLTLSEDALDDSDSAGMRSAARLHAHQELDLPYYYGMGALCAMATNNIEELLTLAASLFEGLLERQMLRKRTELNPAAQEKLLVAAALKRLAFVPRNHTEGTRAKALLEAMGSFCREKTYMPNAPYAPGVCGVRLSRSELDLLQSQKRPLGDLGARLVRVLSECVAENLLTIKQSAASTGREPGWIFYLNRGLCAAFDLPLQRGGWQDVSTSDLISWMSQGRKTQQLSLHV